MRHKWILFHDGCPECSMYEETNLPFLADTLLQWEGTNEQTFELTIKLKELPTGITAFLHGKRVVKILESDQC